MSARSMPASSTNGDLPAGAGAGGGRTGAAPDCGFKTVGATGVVDATGSGGAGAICGGRIAAGALGAEGAAEAAALAASGVAFLASTGAAGAGLGMAFAGATGFGG